MKRYLIRTGAIAASVVLAFTAIAIAHNDRKTECAGNLCIIDEGGISPDKLPKRGTAPVTATFHGKIETRDGSHPPALESIKAEFDKTIGVEAEGLPTCRPGQIQATSSAGARRACGSAIVGGGTAGVEVSFPEQAPITSTGPVLLFNGGVKGRTTKVLLHTYVNVPAPTAIVVVAAVTRINRDPYGLELTARIPKIAGGAGSTMEFDLKVGRKYTYKGEKKSFLVAGCPTGHWLARGEVRFSDQTRLGLSHVFTCTPKG
jgi:hypothetical protein